MLDFKHVLLGSANVNTIINDKTGRLKKYNALVLFFVVLFSQGCPLNS
jgi:hypothetical protein